MRIRKFMIDGKEINGFQGGDGELQMQLPTRNGIPVDHRQSQHTLTVRRKATRFPDLTLFKLVTGGNGDVVYCNGSIEVEDQEGNDAMVYDFERGTVAHWELGQSTAEGHEEAVIRAEFLTCRGAGDSKTVDVRKTD